MTTSRFKLLCIVTAIAFVFIACTFVSCETCEPESEYTVAVSDNSTIMDLHGPLWNMFSATDIREYVMDSLRSQFNGTHNLLLVTVPANIHIFIDTIRTDSYEWEESRTDPCYGDHSWLYQMAFPPEVYTYRLHKTEVVIVYTVVDSVHMKTGWGSARGVAEEYLIQPSGDSTQCFQYEIAGDYDNTWAIVRAVRNAFQNFKCEIKKMMEP